MGGVLKPLVSMMAVQAEPRHYAGLALLKLADNFENHVAIAKEGGIQALLRLGRTRTTDDELQYKAALTVGNLASNAVKLLPKGGDSQAVSGEIGFAAQQMMAKKTEVAAKRGREKTEGFLERAGVNDGAADAGLYHLSYWWPALRVADAVRLMSGVARSSVAASGVWWCALLAASGWLIPDGPGGWWWARRCVIILETLV